MPMPHTRPTPFLLDETAAVTVDWVVLTAALVGLGLAVSTLISSGTATQSSQIDTRLRDVDLVTAFDAVVDSADFSDGRGNWVGGEVLDINGFGEVLALSGASRTARLPIDVGGEYSYAEVQFDMIIADSWDNESGTISIGGTDVVLTEHHWRNDAPQIQTFDGSGGTSVTLTRTSTGTGGGWRPGVTDHTYRVSVVARNGSNLELGAQTTLNQRAGDEFFGIDNVTVTGTDTRR